MSSTASTAGLAFLNWWARYCSIRAVNATIPLFGLQQLTTALAVIKPLTSINRHGFNLLVIAFRAGDFRLQFGHAACRFQSALSVMRMKIPRAGKSTMSKYPTKAGRPTAPNKITRTGVKQHSAAITVPANPNFNKLSIFIPIYAA